MAFRLIPATVLIAIGLAATPTAAQPPASCSAEVLRALKSLPKLEYDCPENPNDSDDKILNLPERLAAIRRIKQELERFTNANWWQANADELLACKVHGSAGQLTREEKQAWTRGEYTFDLIGDHQMRLVLISDPCYQTGYGGSNGYLLYRNGPRTVVSQVLNGYYSRVENSVGLDFANLNGERLIEVSTSNSFPPMMLSYFFAINSRTKIAVPRRIFQEGGKLTNEIYSSMLMGDPQEFGFPRNAVELRIIRNHTLAPSFSSYSQGDIPGKFQRTIYRWNGRIYVKQNRRR